MGMKDSQTTKKARTDKMYQHKTGAKCGCKKGIERDNCPSCEGTGNVIDFAAIRSANMTPQPTHTPLPWKSSKREDGFTDILNSRAMNGLGEYDVCIARLSNSANAAFIVRAVNAHQELLSIAHHFVEYIENHGGKTTPELLQAIACAEGKGGIK
jgi:hypothetical protein